ncbi:MFS transporter [Citrobacter amalonaticus]|uniref:MFS transporter n=1 Tax=Citrobacter amalonaticus TaxID=35703 RepID=UPI001902CC50|nr:MFS transporter [Citrobacter amalonaticus]MBJ9277677.1 MFS transporter [Citrobacter amalonaticus]MEC5722513.1 MFS transporter [Citrobacter amalonaticus]
MSQLHPSISENTTKPQLSRSRYRWTICALLFFSVTINNLDRSILGLLAPMLQKDIGWTEIEYGNIVTAFQAAYAVGLLICGRIVDLYGARLILPVALAIWSLAAMAHGAVGTVTGFIYARIFLGVGESANFPSAVKVAAEWFPKRERAFATGIFNSGSNVGNIFAPIIIPWIALQWGWREAFVVTGAVGLIWIVFWLFLYGKPEKANKVNKEELEWIHQDEHSEPTPATACKVSWIGLLKYRQTWAFAMCKFLTDPIFWFFLFWLPKWLHDSRGIDMAHMATPLVLINILATIGGLAGGYLPAWLINRGIAVNKARKLTLFLCAICVLPILLVSTTSNLWVTVILIGIAVAAHQGWSVNLYTSVSDMFPKEAVGAVVGIGCLIGSIGSILFAQATGHILQATGSYWSIFLMGGFAYLLGFIIMHFLTPTMSAAKFK